MKRIVIFFISVFFLLPLIQGCSSSKKDPYKYVLEDSVAQRMLDEYVKVYKYARLVDVQNTPLWARGMLYDSPVCAYSLPYRGKAPLDERYVSVLAMSETYMNTFSFGYEIAREVDGILESVGKVYFVYNYNDKQGWIESSQIIHNESKTSYSYMNNCGEVAYKDFQELSLKKEYIINFTPASLAHISPTAKKGKRVC